MNKKYIKIIVEIIGGVVGGFYGGDALNSMGVDEALKNTVDKFKD